VHRDLSEFERFIHRVHRRYVALRLVEQTGLGILAGAGVGLPLVAIAIWRSLPAATLAIASLTLGAIAGLLHGYLTRPIPLQSALEADRQLETADLLSSAWSLRQSPDPWAQAMRSSADHWSRSTQPSTVILNRLGARAWGGVGLATALLLVLTMLPTYARPTQAADNPSASNSVTDPQQNPQITQSHSRVRTFLQQDPEDLNSNRMSPSELNSPPLSPPGSNASTDPAHSSLANDPNGRGASESHSKSNSAQLPRNSDPTSSNPTSSPGRTASGTGQTGQHPITPGNNSSQIGSVSPNPQTPAAPWKSTQWPQDSDRALRAVDSGQIPDQYRDVIHGYFDRP
jgi:hypothetical protein